MISIFSEDPKASFLKRLSLRFIKKANLFYSFEYQIDFTDKAERKSFDTQKFRKIIKVLREKKIVRFRDLIVPTPITDEDLLLVHTKKYIDWIKRPLNLQQVLNTDYLTIFDEDIFNIFKYIAAGTYEGAKLALETKLPSFNLSGGFHHARADRGEGFCPINDIAIAIKMLQRENKIEKALVIDLDYHQGNGTRNIFKDDNSVFTFSIHATQWCKKDAINSLDILVDTDIKDNKYLDILQDNLNILENSFDPDIIFYIAGSDPFIKDQLCDMEITEEGMLKRDMKVLNFSERLDKAIIILPAGGYGNESYKIYYNFIRKVLLR